MRIGEKFGGIEYLCQNVLGGLLIMKKKYPTTMELATTHRSATIYEHIMCESVDKLSTVLGPDKITYTNQNFFP